LSIINLQPPRFTKNNTKKLEFVAADKLKTFHLMLAVFRGKRKSHFQSGEISVKISRDIFSVYVYAAVKLQNLNLRQIYVDRRKNKEKYFPSLQIISSQLNGWMSWKKGAYERKEGN
jgi:hypothetical protein